MYVNSPTRLLIVYVFWHTVYWCADYVYYHACARSYLWSLVTRDSNLCQTLKYIQRIR